MPFPFFISERKYKMGYSNSKLVKYTKISPNRTSPRNHSIDRITPHCYVGQVSAQSMGQWFANSSAQASSNYGIGVDGSVGMFVEEKDRSWCSSSRENDNRAVTIECASDKTHPYAINDTVYNRLIELMADICRRNGKTKLLWFGDKNKTLAYNPKSNEMVMTVHRWFANKSCPGDYIYNRLPQIAEKVNKLLGSSDPVADNVLWYRVRTSWADEKSQLGAYVNLENAKANCPEGYTVFDNNGKAVYSPSAKRVYSPEEWFATVSPIAVKLAEKNKILPSVVIAQTYLETGCGSTDLVSKCNIVGMKADLINGTWSQYSVWQGKTYVKKTPEYHNGQLVYVEDTFRVYSSFEQCLTDYEAFLLNVKNNSGYKYRRIQGVTDPAKVVHMIRIGTGTDSHPEGYCTDPNYEKKIMNIIGQFNLTQYDAVMKKPDTTPTPAPAPTPTPTPAPAKSDKYVVRKSFADKASQTNSFNNLDYAKAEANRHPGYSVYEQATGKLIYPVNTVDKYAVTYSMSDADIKHRLGLFHDLNNAKKLADQNWGYKVYDTTTGSLVYAPKLSGPQKYVAELVRMDLIARDDISEKEYWDYRNKNTSSFSKTFDDARKNNNRHTNCVSGPQWGLIGSGAVPSDRKAIQWYGGADKIVWCDADAEKNCKKYFNVIRVGTKTVKECIKDGTIVPGDIITYVKLSHTNVYIANGMSFDTGHANCTGTGEGAKFKQFICATPYLGYKVAYILRLKA